MLVVDAHLDLSMNALEWNRDLREPVAAIRAREAGLTDRPDRGRGTVSFPEMRRARIGLVVATQIARYVAPGNSLPGWHSAEQAWAMILAGATAVQIYTALVYEGLSLAARVARGLDQIAAREGFARVSDATGTGRDRWL